MLYGVEINEPYQSGVEAKLRCMLGVSEDEDHTMSWTSRPHRTFCTAGPEHAKQLADTLAESWDAQVVPVEEGVEFSAEDMPAVIDAFKARQRTAAKQARQIR